MIIRGEWPRAIAPISRTLEYGNENDSLQDFRCQPRRLIFAMYGVPISTQASTGVCDEFVARCTSGAGSSPVVLFIR